MEIKKEKSKGLQRGATKFFRLVPNLSMQFFSREKIDKIDGIDGQRGRKEFDQPERKDFDE